jgi:hypothetical protein
MHNHHNREVSIQKSALIKKIKENKDIHVKDYEEAIIAYRKEAEAQLNKLSNDLKNGALNLKLNLITPVDRSSEYDKVIEMFEWELAEVVKLTQREFNEYIHDDTSEAVQSRMLNSTYKGK